MSEDKEKQKMELLDLIVEKQIKDIDVGQKEFEETKRLLANKYPAFDISEIDKLFKKSGNLHLVCYQIADKIRDKAITYEEGMREIRKICPDFSEKAYEISVSHAFFVTR